MPDKKHAFFYRNPKIFMAAFLVIGFCFFYLGYKNLAASNRIATNPGITQAEIILKEKRNERYQSKRGLAFHLAFSLSEPTGDNAYESISNVTRETYDSHNIGDAIEIRFDPQDPSFTIVDEDRLREDSTFLLIISLVFFGLTVVMILDRPVRRFFGLNDPYGK